MAGTSKFNWSEAFPIFSDPTPTHSLTIPFLFSSSPHLSSYKIRVVDLFLGKIHQIPREFLWFHTLGVSNLLGPQPIPLQSPFCSAVLPTQAPIKSGSLTSFWEKFTRSPGNSCDFTPWVFLIFWDPNPFPYNPLSVQQFSPPKIL